MRTATALVLVGFCLVVLPLDRVLACGDKLLLHGRDFPYSRPYAAINPASILIYAPKAAKNHGAGTGLASELRRAGHDAEVAGDVPRMARRLRSGQIDVVLTSIGNMQDVKAASVECPSHPVLLPVLFDASAAELEAAKSQYGFALKAPDYASRFLGTIDKAMDNKPSHATRRH
jgi:hypothetical protein